MADVLKGLEAFYGALDISGLAVSFDAAVAGEVLESRPFNSTMVRKQGGMANYSGSASGVMSSAEPASTMYGDLLTAQNFQFYFAIGTFGAAASEGDLAFLGAAINGGIQWGNQNGQLAEWTLPMQFEALPLGFVLARGTKTSTGNGTGVQFVGGIADGQTAYFMLTVPTATSGTFDLIIESDDNAGFTSATTRATFAQVTTTATSELITWTPAGGNTDDYYRASWTSASTPSHNIAVSMGIL